MASYSIFLVLSISLYQFCLNRADESVIVNLSSGKVRGKMKISPNGLSSKIFLGLPFAQPPVGKLRFAPPEPAEPWTGIRDVTSFPPICTQLPMLPPLNETVAGLSTSEDCLFLNVFSPAYAEPHSKLPVMVYIHGGGFIFGGAPADELSAIIATLGDVIVVGIQYRLGILGFLNVPGTDIQGNFGLMDQIEALKWVQRNIAKFGGDPSNVTIFGESAGAISVALLMLIPQAKNLFHRTIAQSGAADSHKSCIKVKDTAKSYEFLDYMKCPRKDQNFDCMRSKKTEEILKGQLWVLSQEMWPFVTMTPVVDGLYITDIPRNLLRQGNFHRVPSIFGMNTNEGALIPTMMFGLSFPLSHYTKQLFHRVINASRNTPEDDNKYVKAAIIQQYTKHGVPETPETIREQIMEVWHDKFATAPMALSLQSFATAGIPGYFYIFKHRSKYSTWPEWAGVNHADELPYVFGTPFKTPDTCFSASGFTAMEKGLSWFMIKMWTNFAKHGDPNIPENGQDLVAWPKYTNDNKVFLEIGLECKIGRNYRVEAVAFWNEFLPKLSAAATSKHAARKENKKDEL